MANKPMVRKSSLRLEPFGAAADSPSVIDKRRASFADTSQAKPIFSMSGSFKPAWVRKQQLAWDEELSDDSEADNNDGNEHSSIRRSTSSHSDVCGALRQCLNTAANLSGLNAPFSKFKRDAVRDCMANVAKVRNLQPDEVLCKQGEIHRCLFLVLSGQLVVTMGSVQGDAKPVAKIRSGELLGELSFFLGTSSNVTVRAASGNQSFVKRSGSSSVEQSGSPPRPDGDRLGTCTVAVLDHHHAMELLQASPQEMCELFQAVTNDIMDRIVKVSAELGLGTNLHRHLIGLEGEVADDRSAHDIVRQFELQQQVAKGKAEAEQELTAVVRCKIALDGQAEPRAGSVFLLSYHLCTEQSNHCCFPSRRSFHMSDIIGVLAVGMEATRRPRQAPDDALDAINVQLKTAKGAETLTLLMRSAVLSEFAVRARFACSSPSP